MKKKNIPDKGQSIPASSGTGSKSNRVERDAQQIIEDVTITYLDSLDPANLPDVEKVRCDLTSLTKHEFEKVNAIMPKDAKRLPVPTSLTPYQVAMAAIRLYRIVRINMTSFESRAGMNEGVSQGERDTQPLGMYIDHGEKMGIYETSSSELQTAVMNLSHFTNRTWFDIELYLRMLSPEVFINRNPNLVAVNNGIFDIKRKMLLPFTPDTVFVSKTGVDYVDNPKNPVIINTAKNYTWDVESWVREISDDAEIEQLLWEIGYAVLCPYKSWNKMVCFYSEQGNNGKGTFCEMLRNLIPGGHTSISIEQFSKEYYLAGLLNSQAIITDENTVGFFATDMSNFKAVITQDDVRINVKYKSPCVIRWNGFMIQCINDLPKVKDRTDSMYRRMLFVPFSKSFTGCEKKEIKDEYLKRQDVLEYVQWKLLHMDVDELSNPKACQDLMATYKEYNDSTREFWNEFRDQFVWDLLPWTFLYDLYKAWFKLTYPSGTVSSRNVFIKDMKNALWGDSAWQHTGDSVSKTGTLMDKPEHLIYTYGLMNWADPGYKGSDINRICCPKKAQTYRGVRRV